MSSQSYGPPIRGRIRNGQLEFFNGQGWTNISAYVGDDAPDVASDTVGPHTHPELGSGDGEPVDLSGYAEREHSHDTSHVHDSAPAHTHDITHTHLVAPEHTHDTTHTHDTEHTHDTSHTHDEAPAHTHDTTHDHDADYADAAHTHDITHTHYVAPAHDHDANYASVGHTHATAAHDHDYAAADHTHAPSAPALSEAFPVGSVFLSVLSTSPATLLGYGTWSRIAAGRFLVGQDSAATAYDTAEETGGAATHAHADHTGVINHTHPVSITDPGHFHDEYRNSATTGALDGWAAGDTSTNTPLITGYDTGSKTTGITAAAANPAGGVSALSHDSTSNVPPYFVVYAWKRIA